MGRLEWNRRVERDRNVLERILALLLALAILTDRAAGLPAARRMHLLATLGHGEAMARDFILAIVSEACSAMPAIAAGKATIHGVFAPPPARSLSLGLPKARPGEATSPVEGEEIGELGALPPLDGEGASRSEAGGVPVRSICDCPAAAGDAALLAARFRMLALALGVLLAQARAPCRSTSPRTWLPRRKPRQSSQFTPSPAVRATSPPARGEKSQRRQRCSFLRTGQCARSLSALALTRGSAHP